MTNKFLTFSQMVKFLRDEAQLIARSLSQMPWKLLREFTSAKNLPLLVLASLKLIIHFLTNGQYGLHKDELLILAQSEFLAWGYPDGSPIVPFLAHVIQYAAGSSLFILRLLPALAGSAVVILTGLIVRKLGTGGRFAEVLAALCMIVAPANLFTNTMLTAEPFDQLFWSLATYLFLCVLTNPGNAVAVWLLASVCGLGIINDFFYGYLVPGIVRRFNCHLPQ